MYKKRLVSYVIALVMIFSTFVYTNASAVGDDASIDQIDIQQSETVGESTQENIETEDAVENAATEDAADAANEEQTNTEPAAPAEETESDETATMPEDGEAEDSEPAGEVESSNENETAAEPPTETAAPTSDLEQGEVSDAEGSEDGLEEELEATSAYYDLSDEEKAELLEVYTLNESVVLDCANAGFSVQQIIDIAPLIQFAGITAQQYISMSAFYENQEDLETQLKTFGNYTYKYPSLGIENDEICKTLLSEGYSADSILTAYLIIRELGGGDIRNYLDIDDIFSVTELSEEQIINILSLIGSDIETLATAEDYYDQSKYPMAPFDYKSRGNEMINTSTGSVGYNTDNISLPGANGLNLNIGARYDSTYSSGGYIYSTGWDLTPGMWFDRSYTPLMEFAVGWSFNFSYIKVIDVSWLYTESQVITSDGARYTMYKHDIEDSSETEITLNYRSNSPKQHSMFKDKSYSYGGLTSAYRLEYKDGTKEYFDKDGILMKTENRFGDKITYKYEKTGTEQSDGSVDHARIYEKYNKVTITDTCGRETVIERTARKSEAAVSSECYTGEYHEIIVTLPAADTETEASTLTYKIKKVKNDNDPKHEGHYLYFQILDSITERDGSKTTFKYMQNQSLAFSYNPFSTNSSVWENYQHYYPISEIIYPTGAKTIYSYEINSGFLGTYYNDNTNQYFRVTNRKDISETGDEYNNISYSYYNNYLLHGDYSVTETNSDGVSIEYYYTRSDETSDDMSRPASSGGFRVKTSETTYLGGDKDNTLNKVEYGSYYKRTYPSSVKTTVYNDEGDSVSTTQLYKYNEYGDLMESWSAKAEGDETNVEYKTTYTYDDTYHLPLTTENKRDSSTTLKTENILTSNGKAVSETRKYENNNLVSKTTYTYANANSQNPTVTTQYANVNSNETLVTNYEYQNNALITKQTTGSSVTQYEYDGMGRLIKTIDPNGNATQTVYDCMDRAVETINPDGSEVANEYPVPNADGTISANKITTTDGNGNKMEYNYDKLGLLENIKESGATYNLVSYDYDSMGRIISLTDGNGNVYNYTYDERSRKTNLTVKNPSNSVVYTESYDYNEVDGDDNSVVTTSTGSGGFVVSAQYTNKYGELVKETSGTGEDMSTTQYAYNYVGDKISEISPKGKTVSEITNLSDNGAGTRVVTTDYYDNQTIVKYDMLGRVIETQDGNGNKVYSTYNSQGLLSSETRKIDGNDSVKTYVYDNNGNVKQESVTSNKIGETAAVNTNYYDYDSMNRLIKTNTDEPGETLYEYDDNGNITKMTTGAVNGTGGVSTTYEYDSQNRLVKTTDPMGYTETYTYDNNSNMTNMVDKNGVSVTTTYNGINSPVTETRVNSDGMHMKLYTYYSGTSMVEKVATSIPNNFNLVYQMEYEYDTRGLITKTTSTANEGTECAYEYDEDGNQTGVYVKYDGGTVENLKNTYNYIGQLTEVKDERDNKVLAEYTYDNAGNLVQKKGDGQKTLYSYNESNQLETISNMSLANEESGAYGCYSRYSYEYSLDGSRVKETDIVGNTTEYSYDKAGRLTKENVTEGVNTSWTEYTYDARGNRVSKYTSADDITVDYTYDLNNRLYEETWIEEYYDGSTYYDVNHWRSYTYDNNGNMLSKTEEKAEFPRVGDDVATITEVEQCKTENYTYYPDNMMKTYSEYDYKTGESETASYRYDAMGRRVDKHVGNIYTEYIWSGDQIVGEVADGYWKNYYRGLGGEILSNRNGQTYAYDGHGDVVSLNEQSGINLAFIDTYEYDAFGNETLENEKSEYNPFRYNGQYYDEETGFIYLRNRYYDPGTGRFTSEDPVKDGFNWYVYCANNPIAFVDPSGLTIILQGTAEEKMESFAELQMLTNDELYMDPETGVVTIVENGNIMNAEYDLVAGTELVASLINDEEFECVIVRNMTDENGNKYGSQTFNYRGSYSSVVTINDDEVNEKVLTVSATGERKWEQIPDYIKLGHEMIHAFRFMNDETNYGSFGFRYYVDENYEPQYERSSSLYINDEEFEVVGLTYFNNVPVRPENIITAKAGAITENALRVERGLPIRIAYGTRM